MSTLTALITILVWILYRRSLRDSDADIHMYLSEADEEIVVYWSLSLL
jgi:hypothetical protein